MISPRFLIPMSIWSRLAEVLGEVGGSIIGFLSRAAGGERELRSPERSIAFTIGMIALGAKMAKADGIVTVDEIEAFKQVFEIPRNELKNVARVFNLAKQDVAGFDAYARHMARLFGAQPQVLEDVMDGLFHIAKADGRIDERELEYLKHVAEIFMLREPDFVRIKARHMHLPKDDPYIILGVEPGLPDAALKRHYRKLVQANHPDRHIAAGVPPEMIDIATKRLAAINAAYRAIAKARGL
jgi:DnaJ like chaperone protein